MKKQKTTEKKQPSKKVASYEDINTCKCDTANTLFSDLKQQYDEIAIEKDNLKIEKDNLKIAIIKLQSELEKKDSIIRALQKKIDLYRNRTVWQTIKTRWFGL